MFGHPTWLWITLGVVNIPVYVMAGSWVFGNWDGFKEGLRLAIQPDWWSFIKGELAEDWQEGFRMFLFVIICAAAVIGEAWLLSLVFG